MTNIKELEFDLQLFADDDPGPSNKDANAGGQQGGEELKNQQPFAVFPDERSFMARVNREAKQQLEAQAKALGFESAEAMQAAFKAAKEKADSEKTELQKAQERAEAAEAAKVQALEAANRRLIRAEVTLKSTELGIVDPDVACALMDRSGVSVGEDGAVTGVDEALKALLAAKPYLKKVAAAGPGGGTTNPAPGSTDVNPWAKETFNLTKQAQILKENPARAAQLKAAAGVK